MLKEVLRKHRTAILLAPRRWKQHQCQEFKVTQSKFNASMAYKKSCQRGQRIGEIKEGEEEEEKEKKH